MSREDDRKYYNDVSFDLWMSGKNPDADYDEVISYKDAGYYPEETVSALSRREHRKHEEAEDV